MAHRNAVRAPEDRAHHIERDHGPEAPRLDSAANVGRSHTMPGRALARLGRFLHLWIQGWSDRHLLAGLNDHALRDLGLDRDAVDRDSVVSPWRLR